MTARLVRGLVVSSLVSCFVASNFCAPAFCQNVSQSAESEKGLDALVEKASREERYSDLPQAEKFYKRAYDLAKCLPTDDLRRVKVVDSLAHIYELEGRYAAAESMYNESLDLRQNSFGEGSQRLSKSHYNIGRVKMLAGDYNGARHRLSKALNLRQFSKSDDKNQSDLPLAFILYHLGVLELETGNLEKASEHLNRAQSIARQTASHKESARVMSQTALLNLAQGNIVQADNEALTALSMIEKFSKEDMLDKANALAVVAQTKLASGDLKAADQAANEAWNLRHRVLGGEHPVTADTVLTTGLIRLAEKKWEVAEQCFTQAINIEGNSINCCHLSYARAHIGLAFAQLKLHKVKEAKKNLDKGVEILSKGSGNSTLSAKYKDLYITKIGATHSWIDVIKEKVKAPDATLSSKGDFDVFGTLLASSLTDEETDMFFFTSYKDVFAALGVTFALLVLLATAVMVPGVFSWIFPWGRQERNKSTATPSYDYAPRKKKNTEERGTVSETPAQKAARSAMVRKTTESEKRQIQVWSSRLKTMENNVPVSSSRSSDNATIDFQPDSNAGFPLPLPQNHSTTQSGNDGQYWTE